jgi:hypothetical protein
VVTVMQQKQNRRMCTEYSDHVPAKANAEIIYLNLSYVKDPDGILNQASPIEELWWMKGPISSSLIFCNKRWHK